MGITIQDSITFDVGATLSNTYGSLAKNSVIINSAPDDDDYDFKIHAKGRVWIDKAKRDEEDSPYLDNKNINIGITKGQLDGNVYTLLYTEFKTNYTSTIDVTE